MANTTIQLKKSATPGSVPSAGSLANGEIALNFADGILYYKTANGSVAAFSSDSVSFGTINAAGTLLISDTVNDVLDVRAGSNIVITGDAINDRMTIDADLTAANNWANTKLANTSGISFAGDLYFPSGNVGIGTTSPTYKLEIVGDVKANSFISGNSRIYTATVVTSTATDQILDSFTNTAWRSANYVLTMTSGTDYHTTQVTLIHDGSNAYITEYGTLSTANNLGLFTATVVSGTVRLNVTPTFATTTINMVRTTNK